MEREKMGAYNYIHRTQMQESPNGKASCKPERAKTEAPKSEELLLPNSKIDWEKKFLDTFKQLIYAHRPWDVWRDLIIMNACAISNAVDRTHYDEREKRYLSIIKKYSRTEIISRVMRLHNHGVRGQSRTGFSWKDIYGTRSWKYIKWAVLYTVFCMSTYVRNSD